MSDQKFIAKLMLIDNDRSFHQTMDFAFGNLFKIDTAIDRNIGVNLLNKNKYDVLLMDLALDRADRNYKEGLERIISMKKDFPLLPLIVVTNDKQRETIVTALRNGADDFIYKGDFDIDKWQEKIFNAIKTTRNLKVEDKKESEINSDDSAKKSTNNRATDKLISTNNNDAFIGDSPNVKELRKKLEFLGQQKIKAVLISGETGTGKNVAARYFHQNSLRKDKVFQVANISSFKEDLIESELFGHVKGSFTGAISDKIGHFEHANLGTIFLDEIGEISPEVQVKLLGFLEDRMIQRVGSTKPIYLDVQIVAATNRDLEKEVAEGRFREDLFYRLNKFPLKLPPLRERRSDLILLMEHYFNVSSNEIKLLFAEEAFESLQIYPWPGNIRELLDSLDHMELYRKFYEKKVIDHDCFPKAIKRYKPTNDLEKIKKENPNLSIEEQYALGRLNEIEETLIKLKDKKGEAAIALGKNNTDGLRYEIETYYDKYPEFFENLSHIKKVYNKSIRKISLKKIKNNE